MSYTPTPKPEDACRYVELFNQRVLPWLDTYDDACRTNLDATKEPTNICCQKCGEIVFKGLSEALYADVTVPACE